MKNFEYTPKTDVFIEHFAWTVAKTIFKQDQSQVQLFLRQVLDYDNPDSSNYYVELALAFNIAQKNTDYQISGLAKRVYDLKNLPLDFDSNNLDQDVINLLARPIAEEVETLIYETTSVILKKPINVTLNNLHAQ